MGGVENSPRSKPRPRLNPVAAGAVSNGMDDGEREMMAVDTDADLERLMRRWHHTTEYATASWAEYQALRDALPASSRRVQLAHATWRAAEQERRELMKAIEVAEATEAA